MTFLKRLIACTLATTLCMTAFVQSAQATTISTEQVAHAQRAADDARASALATLERADVAAALTARGVDLQQARERIAALTDDEAATLAATLDSAPAAGSDVLGVIVFIFVLLLVTDILGLTKVFPFTRTVR